MATYRNHVTPISRGKGKSAVAAAAYRAGVKLTNERDGKTHDYSRRQRGIVDVEIFAPDHAPDWIGDRARLWNEAEKVDNRKNSVLGRESLLSLPHELTDAQRLELTRAYCHELVIRYGVAVDMSIHRPDPKSDQRNHHAHILFTTREITAEGLGKKTRVLDDVRNQGPKEFEWMRQRWADLQNDALERANVVERVDHRSYKRQGVEKEPEPRLGPKVHAMEQEGQPTLKGDWVRALRAGDLEAADKAAVLYHVHQVERHGDKPEPVPGKPAVGRKWVHKVPPTTPERVQFVRGGAKGAFSRQAAPTPAEIPKTPVAPFPDPFKAIEEEAAKQAKRPKAVSWAKLYEGHRADAQALQRKHAQQQHVLDATHGGRRLTPAGAMFERLTATEADRAAQTARERTHAELINQLLDRQKADRAELAKVKKQQRKELADQLAGRRQISPERDAPQPAPQIPLKRELPPLEWVPSPEFGIRPRSQAGPLPELTPAAGKAPAPTPEGKAVDVADTPEKAAWRVHYRQAKEASEVQAKQHERQRDETRAKHAPPPAEPERKGLAKFLAREKIAEEAREIELARRRQADALRALERRQETERRQLEEWKEAERKRIGRELAKAARDRQKPNAAGQTPEKQPERSKDRDGGHERERRPKKKPDGTEYD